MSSCVRLKHGTDTDRATDAVWENVVAEDLIGLVRAGPVVVNEMVIFRQLGQSAYWLIDGQPHG
jgi:hypothetical protein